MSEQAVQLVPRQDLAMAAPASESSALIHMIERVARDPSIDLARLERLIEMKERITAREAKSAFDTAFAAMQEHLPIIDERGQHGGTKTTYAKWDDINEAIKPVLAAHGFSLRFRIKQDSNKVIVTGILGGHGHSEEATLELPIDNSGQKNAVQAIGSSQSYGQRYTAKALLSLSSRKSDDDDGRAANVGDRIAPDQLAHLIQIADEVGADKAKFCKYMQIASLADLPLSKLPQAIDALNAKKVKQP